jgi:hypothetical protein
MIDYHGIRAADVNVYGRVGMDQGIGRVLGPTAFHGKAPNRYEEQGG